MALTVTSKSRYYLGMCRIDRILLGVMGTVGVTWIAGACASTAATTGHPRIPMPSPVRTVPARLGVAKAPLPPANPKLPPVPAVHGPLDIHVVYPTENALITSRDSNFIFGSVGNGVAGLTVNGQLVPVWPNGAFLGWLPNPPADAQYYDLVAYTATDTVRLRYPVRTRAAQPPVTPVPPSITTLPTPEGYVLWDDSMSSVDDTDRVIIGRPSPTGTYRWFLFPETEVLATEFQDGMAHVQLDGEQMAWVSRRDLHHPTDRWPNDGRTGDRLTIERPITADVHEGWVDIDIPVVHPPAYLVDEGDRAITLTLYNTTGSAAMALPEIRDPYVTHVRSEVSASRVTLTIELHGAPYGYLALYDHGMMTFRVRRPPTVDPAAPLRGRTIAIDAGHPPAGATGPTGLYEPVPTLAVAFRVRDMLRARGATVIMTRTTADPVALGDRPIMARRKNAEALVSIHLNAFPDGINPLRDNGTGTYYFQSHSKLFATLMQRSLVPELGLRDLGTFRENLALARPTWMPAVLTEGLFIILPDQEAAIRTPEYQDAYARGIVAGLEHFFATLTQ